MMILLKTNHFISTVSEFDKEYLRESLIWEDIEWKVLVPIIRL